MKEIFINSVRFTQRDDKNLYDTWGWAKWPAMSPYSSQKSVHQREQYGYFLWYWRLNSLSYALYPRSSIIYHLSSGISEWFSRRCEVLQDWKEWSQFSRKTSFVERWIPSCLIWAEIHAPFQGAWLRKWLVISLKHVSIVLLSLPIFTHENDSAVFAFLEAYGIIVKAWSIFLIFIFIDKKVI